jgi:putative RecB family exonuclease
LFQMKFYAGAVAVRGQVPRLLQLMYLGSGEVLRYVPDEADPRATERKVSRWAISRATERGDWRSPSRLCDWCEYKVRAGVRRIPPPMPERPVADTAPAEDGPQAAGRPTSTMHHG